MNYELNKSQKMLQKSARDFLSRECSSELVRKMAADEKGVDPEIWEKMAELGWMGINIPPEYGGGGFDFMDLVILLQQMGYYALPGPFFASVVLGGMAILEAGSEEQKKRLLPEIAEGTKKFTMAWMEAGSGYAPQNFGTRAAEKGEQYVLSGSKRFVPDARAADCIICFAQQEGHDGVSAFVVDADSPGVQVNELVCFSGEKLDEVVFDGVEIPTENMLGEPGKGGVLLERILSLAAVGKCAEMSGGARMVMNLAVPYAKTRKQFGRPVGAFQAIQHHLADMLTYADTMEFMTLKAAWLISAGFSADREVSICKAWASDSYKKLVRLGHQVIGGMGFMEEYDLQLYFKRAKTAEVLFGDGDFHRERVAKQIFS
jgi:alkylation response protein AidB-like acyl-CoA dehydrogenase